MNIVTGIVVYVIAWWLVLLMVLPWGVRPLEDPNPGEERGAPEAPRMWLKVLVTTGIATAIWIAIYFFIEANLFSFREHALP